MIDEKIAKELERIKAYPLVGHYTCLHHDKVVEKTDNLMERIDCILKTKDPSEHFIRLRHIYPVPTPAAKVFEEACVTALKIHDEACRAVGKIYDKARAPDWKVFEKAGGTAKAWKIYFKAVAPARKAFEEDYAAAVKIYDEARAAAGKGILDIIPDCAWDGKTILDDE